MPRITEGRDKHEHGHKNACGPSEAFVYFPGAMIWEYLGRNDGDGW